MPGTTITHGATRIYLRQQLADSLGWLEVTGTPYFWRLGGPVMRHAGRISQIVLLSKIPGLIDDVHKWWVKVTHQPSGGSETPVWLGHIEDSVINESVRQTEWHCVSIEAQLRNIRLRTAYAQNVDPAGDACEITLRPINDEVDNQDRLILGRRGDTLHHFALGGTFLNPTGGAATDTAYAFGVSSLWSNGEALDALLAWNVPSGGRNHCPIGFVAAPTTAAQTYLDNAKVRHDLEGRTLLEAVEALVTGAGPLMWWVDFTDYLAGTDAYLSIVVASGLWADEESDEDTVKLNLDRADCLAGTLRRQVHSRCTTVIARGAPIRAMFSVQKSSYSGYVKGWDATLESDWETARGTNQEGAPKYADVWRRYIVQPDQTLLFEPTITAWSRRLFQPSTTSDPVGLEMVQDAQAYPRYYAAPRRTLPHNLTYRGWTQPTSNGDTLPSPPSAQDPAEPEYDPILGWHVASGGEVSILVVHSLTGLRPCRHQTGVVLPLAYRDSNCGFSIWKTDEWENMLFTLSVELDTRVEWVETLGVPPDDQRRIEV
ncbi:MAG TPA: hypothetical protein VMW48_18965, partial [Vicinamibacterales bacterium]|nr:hypothetical protein [Vicinamibacterales bacterium]